MPGRRNILQDSWKRCVLLRLSALILIFKFFFFFLFQHFNVLGNQNKTHFSERVFIVVVSLGYFCFFRRSHQLSDMRTDVRWKSWHELLRGRLLLRRRTSLSIPFQALFNQDAENKSLWCILSKFWDYLLSKSSHVLWWKHVEFEFHVFQIY